MTKLSKADYIELENLMEKVPNPDETFTATGWHYELAAFLRRLGIRTSGRYDAYHKAIKLLEEGYDEE